MRLQMLEDTRERPDLFCWAGAPGDDALAVWIDQRSLLPGPELRFLLHTTGGGDMFETETILRPFGGRETADNADEVNDLHRRQGLHEGLWLFHVGLVLSAVDQRDGRIVTLTDDYAVREQFQSLDEWYIAVIRDEYADRYGLKPLVARTHRDPAR